MSCVDRVRILVSTRPILVRVTFPGGFVEVRGDSARKYRTMVHLGRMEVEGSDVATPSVYIEGTLDFAVGLIGIEVRMQELG